MEVLKFIGDSGSLTTSFSKPRISLLTIICDQNLSGSLCNYDTSLFILRSFLMKGLSKE